jgi:hypothetical protein
MIESLSMCEILSIGSKKFAETNRIRLFEKLPTAIGLEQLYI